MKATITRAKVYKSPLSNSRCQWKWLYDVTGLPVQLRGFDTISAARRIAKKYGATEIIESWKVA